MRILRNSLKTVACYAWLGFWTPAMWVIAGAVEASDWLLARVLGDPE